MDPPDAYVQEWRLVSADFFKLSIFVTYALP